MPRLIRYITRSLFCPPVLPCPARSWLFLCLSYFAIFPPRTTTAEGSWLSASRFYILPSPAATNFLHYWNLYFLELIFLSRPILTIKDTCGIHSAPALELTSRRLVVSFSSRECYIRLCPRSDLVKRKWKQVVVNDECNISRLPPTSPPLIGERLEATKPPWFPALWAFWPLLPMISSGVFPFLFSFMMVFYSSQKKVGMLEIWI